MTSAYEFGWYINILLFRSTRHDYYYDNNVTVYSALFPVQYIYAPQHLKPNKCI